MFQIEQATKQCAKISLTEPWDPLDIPQNSTFEDQYSIGGPQEQITVQEWSDRKTARSCKDGRIHPSFILGCMLGAYCLLLSPFSKVVVRELAYLDEF